MKTAIFDRAKALLTSVHPVDAQTYLVKSQRGEGVYRVDLEANTCTCPAYTYGHRPCKHLVAVTLYRKLTR
ncbi:MULTISPECIES: SWIM zinc finger family protein [Thermus]|uniref:SWIM zinc finger family protein n=1 Tax=Thermus TaxID=270 RepID=UPI001F2B5E2D|nr:SWIM zinc finger family protein [Thermus brockianus]